jgi:hypothetical protein
MSDTDDTDEHDVRHTTRERIRVPGHLGREEDEEGQGPKIGAGGAELKYVLFCYVFAQIDRPPLLISALVNTGTHIAPRTLLLLFAYYLCRNRKPRGQDNPYERHFQKTVSRFLMPTVMPSKKNAP